MLLTALAQQKGSLASSDHKFSRASAKFCAAQRA
jgi:hypothetical protein